MQQRDGARRAGKSRRDSVRKVGVHVDNFYSMLEALEDALDDDTYQLVRDIIYKFVTHYF